MSNIKLVREKETFRSETLVDVDGSEVKLYVKSSVNYERLTFKVQPVLTLVHDFREEVQEALVEACVAAHAECMARLDKYRSEVGVVDLVLTFLAPTPTPMMNHSAPPPDLCASLLPEKVKARNPLYLSTMIEEIMAGYGVSKQLAAGILESAKSQGLIREHSGFRLQITPPHDTLET